MSLCYEFAFCGAATVGGAFSTGAAPPENDPLPPAPNLAVAALAALESSFDVFEAESAMTTFSGALSAFGAFLNGLVLD